LGQLRTERLKLIRVQGLAQLSAGCREALDTAADRQFPNGARGRGMSLMSDHGRQPNSLAFMQACAPVEIHQAFTSDNNLKGEANTERCIRTLTEECLWAHKWMCPVALVSTLDPWIDDSNEQYLNSALGHNIPRQFERDYYSRHSTPSAAA
jgi:putative transposase